MSLNLFGNATANVFNSVANIDANSTTAWLYASFRFSGANPASGAIREVVGLYVGSTPVGSIQTTFNGAALTAKIRGASDNNDIAAGNIPGAGTQIRVLIKRDTVSGSLKVFANGALITDTTLGAATTLIVPTSLRTMRLSGTVLPATDVSIDEAGYGKGALPSDAEALAWTAGTQQITAFAVPASYQVKPVCDGSIVTTFTSGGLTFTQASGPTVAPDAPTVDGAVAAVTLTVTSITDNNATPAKSRSVANTNTVSFFGRSRPDNMTRLTVAGTYTGGTPAGILLKIGTNAYAAAQSQTIGSGNFSATFVVPQFGYGLSVTDSATENPTTYANMRVGDFFIINGQSNGQGQIDNLDPTDPMPATYLHDQTLIRANPLNDNLTVESAPGQDMAWCWAAAMVQRASGVPQCVINIAYGGQSIDTWAAGGSSWIGGETSLARHGINGHANKPSMIWSQGESDATDVVSAYQAQFLEFVGRLNSQWNVGTIWSHPTFQEPTVDNPDIAIRNAARINASVRVVGSSKWIKLAPNATHNDDIHLESPRDAIAVAGCLGVDMINYLGYDAGIVAQQAYTFYRGSTPIEGIFIGTRQV